MRREQALQHFIPPQLNMLVILSVSLFFLSQISVSFSVSSFLPSLIEIGSW